MLQCPLTHIIWYYMKAMSTQKRLFRSRSNRIIAGICGGLGEYFNIDPTIVRVIFVVVSLLPGPSIVFYLLAWIIIPLKPTTTASRDV